MSIKNEPTLLLRRRFFPRIPMCVSDVQHIHQIRWYGARCDGREWREESGSRDQEKEGEEGEEGGGRRDKKMKKESEKGDPSEQKLKCYYVMLTQAIHCVQLINDEQQRRRRSQRIRRRESRRRRRASDQDGKEGGRRAGKERHQSETMTEKSR